LIVAVLIIAAVVIGLMVRGESTSVHTITGHLQLGDYSGSGIASSGPTCHGNGGYSDIGSWTQVKVTNESGKVLGVTSLGEGRGKAVCYFDFSIEIEDAEYYTVTIGSGRRGDITMSKSELEANNWTVSVSLGS
jgi:hypothetical protein